MALIKCPECGKEISDTCDTCIHCGYKLKESKHETINEEANRLIADAIRHKWKVEVAGGITLLVLGVLSFVALLFPYPSEIAQVLQITLVISGLVFLVTGLPITIYYVNKLRDN